MSTPTYHNEIQTLARRTDWCLEEPLLLLDWSWCEQIPPDCPGLVAACVPPDMSTACAESSCQDGCAGEGCDTPTASAPATLPPTIGWVVVGFVAAILVWAFWRWFGERDQEMVELSGAQPAEEPEALPLGSDADLLEQARAAAAAGRISAAVILARQAALVALERRGAVVLHPSRTDREYLRTLTDAEVATPFRTVVELVERHRYAGRALNLPEVERLLQAAARLSVLLLILLPTTALARPSSHSLMEPWLGRRYNITDTYSSADLVFVAADDLQPDSEALNEVIKNAPMVIAVISAQTRLPEGLTATRGGEIIVMEPDAEGVVHTLKIPEEFVAIDGLDSFISDNQHVYAWDQNQRPVIAWVQRADLNLLLIGAPGLFDDAALLHAENLAALDSLRPITEADEGTYTAAWVDLSEPPAQKPLDVLRRVGLLPALLQGLLLVGIAAWCYGRAFANPTEPMPFLRRDFIEHLKASAAVYRSTQASQRMLAAYGTWTLDRLRRRTREEDDARLPAAVAARAHLDPTRVTYVLTQAKLAAKPDANPSSDDVYLLEELWEIHEQMKQSKR